MTRSNGAQTSATSPPALSAGSGPLRSLWGNLRRLDWRARPDPRLLPSGEAAQSGFSREWSGIHRIQEAPPQREGQPLTAAAVKRWLYGGSGRELEFREQVKALLAREEFAPALGLRLEEQARHSYALFGLVRRHLDLRIRDVLERPARLAAALELVGVVDATLFTILNIHYCLCGGSLLRHGAGAPEIEPYLDELDTGDTIGVFLCTELGYGNNVVSLQTRADYDPERQELVLSTPSTEACKFMPNTALQGVPRLAVVMARLFVKEADCGVLPIVVRIGTRQGTCDGVRVTPLGTKPAFSLDNAITSFHGVRVPRYCLLLGEHNRLHASGRFESDLPSPRARFLRAVEQVQLGRLCLSGVGAAATGASAFIAINYGEQRRTFAPRRSDVNLIEYRNYQRDAFSALAYAYASRCLLDFALAEHQSSSQTEHEHLFLISAATKVHITYATERFVRLCRERCGAAGMFEENRLSAYAAQAQGLVTAEGDNHILLIKMSRQMLLGQGYDRLHKADRAAWGPLTDPGRLLFLLRERERLLLDRVRRRMARAWLPEHDLFALWNENITLAMDAATAHATRLAAERFWLRACELSGEHPVLDLLRLFALQELAPNLGFYLAEELVSRDEVEQHRALLDLTCQALRPVALTLANAWDVTNDLLRAPLGSRDYVATYGARLEEAPPASQ